MKTESRFLTLGKILGILGLVGLILTSLEVFYVNRTSAPISSPDPHIPCKYYVFTDGTYYYAKNCATAAIDYGGPSNAGGVSGTSASAVLNAALNNDNGALVAVSSGTFSLSSVISMSVSGSELSGQGNATLFVGSGIAEDLLMTGGYQSVSHIYFTNPGHNGIVDQGWKSTIQHNSFNNLNTSIYLEAVSAPFDGAAGFDVVNDNFFYSGTYGIATNGGAFTLGNSVIENNFWQAFQMNANGYNFDVYVMGDTQGLMIEKNTFFATGTSFPDSEIAINSHAHLISIVNNVLDQCTEMCIYSQGTTAPVDELTISNNYIAAPQGKSTYGAMIEVHDTTNIVISNNYIFQAPTNAIWFKADNGQQDLDVTVTGNSFEHDCWQSSCATTTGSDIVFDSVKRLSVTGNDFASTNTGEYSLAFDATLNAPTGVVTGNILAANVRTGNTGSVTFSNNRLVP